MIDWADKQVTVLGLGRTGLSAAVYLSERGARVFVSESGEPKAAGDIQLLQSKGIDIEVGQHTSRALEFGDLLVTSPGIPPSSEIIATARQSGKEVISDVELAFRESDIPIIAITGTNGKSTTCALVSHILTKAGKAAPACGNFGVPILDQLAGKPDYLVAEVSSFQLEYCPSLAPAIAVWLNLTPDHLSWHGGLSGYIQAKAAMFRNQRPDQFAVLNRDDPVVAETACRSEIFPFSLKEDLQKAIQGAFLKDGFLAYRISGQTRLVCAADELKIIGRHNLENALAAIAVAALVGVEPSEIEAHLKDFKPLTHRLELVATVGGIAYYNDSKATNPVSTIKALEAFGQQKVVLIAGGRDKGTDLSELVQAAGDHASAVILLGEAKQRFASEFKKGGFECIHEAGSLEEAVELGAQLNKGPVLLSPACASYDMFKDYEDRGRVFKNIVYQRLKRLAPSV